MTDARRDSGALAEGRRVFEKTIAALAAVMDRIGPEFEAGVDLLARCDGRVVVTGVGKSGHVARKLASTLSSTGTPAAFLHTVEATHGDLGFIRAEDVCIVISKSGAGDELREWIPFLAERGCPVVAITGKSDSWLAERADVALDSGVDEEACPLGLAPTTSSTAALVMGDALAIALLQRRGFSSEDFLRFHPSGALGKRLSLRVSDLMRSGDSLPTVSQEATLREALLEIVRGGIGMTCVLAAPGGELWGILSDGDLKRLLIDRRGETLLDRPVADLAAREPRCIGPESLATEALARMETNRPGPITSLVVMGEAGELLGVIHIHDILRAGIG